MTGRRSKRLAAMNAAAATMPVWYTSNRSSGVNASTDRSVEAAAHHTTVAPVAASHIARHGTGAPSSAPASEATMAAAATMAKAVEEPAPFPTLTNAAP